MDAVENKFRRPSACLLGDQQRISVIQEWLDEDKDSVDIKSVSSDCSSRIFQKKSRLFANRLVRMIADARQIANFSFVLIISMVCFQQCYIQFEEFLKYTTRLQVSHTIPPNTLWMIPGVTLCKNNRFNMHKLTELSSDLRVELDEYISKVNSDIKLRDDPQFLNTIKDIIDRQINTTNLFETSSITELAELSRTKLVRNVNCNAVWGELFNCKNILVYESYQNGPCFTMFHMGAKMHAGYTRQIYDFDTNLIDGWDKLEEYSNFEVAEIYIDFDPFEHGDFAKDVGGSLIIHPSLHVGSIKDHAYPIAPGNMYEVFVRRKTNQRLPPPYTTQCFDYVSHNLELFIKDASTSPATELDKTSCVRNCFVKKLMEARNCWPLEAPFFPDQHPNSSIKLCPWASEDRNHTLFATEHTIYFKRSLAECQKICPSSCYFEELKVHVVKKAWPSELDLVNALDKRTRDRLQLKQRCCAKISLRYYDFMEDRLEMIPNMTMTQLISNIGGIVSALVGVSLITVYRFFTRRVCHCKQAGLNSRSAS